MNDYNYKLQHFVHNIMKNEIESKHNCMDMVNILGRLCTLHLVLEYWASPPHEGLSPPVSLYLSDRRGNKLHTTYKE